LFYWGRPRIHTDILFLFQRHFIFSSSDKWCSWQATLYFWTNDIFSHTTTPNPRSATKYVGKSVLLSPLPLFFFTAHIFQCNIHWWYHCCCLSFLARFNSLFLAFCNESFIDSTFYLQIKKKKEEHMQRWFLLFFDRSQVLIDLLSFFVLN
jgi:hypothetical protein